MKQIKRVKVAILDKKTPNKNSTLSHNKKHVVRLLATVPNVPLLFDKDNVFPYDKIPKDKHVGRAHNFTVEKNVLYADFIIKDDIQYLAVSEAAGPLSARMTTEYEEDDLVCIINIYLYSMQEGDEEWTGVIEGELEPYPTPKAPPEQKTEEKFRKD